MFARIAALVYGVFCYLLFLAVFLYIIGFLSNFLVPKGIDTGEAGPLGVALALNIGLLLLFGVQHTVMARPGFKRWWTRRVPRPVERATYNLVTFVVLALLYWLWRPMPGVIWDVQNETARGLLWGIFALGWAVIFVSTVLIDHLDLFGIRQVFLFAKGKAYTPPRFKERAFYKLVRHPLMVGWIITFWATPSMTAGHLLLAGVWSLYILIAIQIEEGDLVKFHGEDYSEYRRRVPMLVPFTKGGSS